MGFHGRRAGERITRCSEYELSRDQGGYEEGRVGEESGVHRHKLTRRRNVTACHLPSMDGSCFVTLYECMCMHTCAHIPVCTYVYIYVTVSLKQ